MKKRQNEERYITNKEGEKKNINMRKKKIKVK